MASVGSFSEVDGDGGGGSGGGAPTDATYIVQTANGSLSNEQAMGALATGLVKNTTTTGVQSIATPGVDYAQALTFAFYRARALSFLGLSSGDPLIFETFEDFDRTTSPGTAAPAGWTAGLVSSGSQSQVSPAPKGGGWRRFSTGASASSQSTLTSFGSCLQDITTTKWYAAFRFQLTTTPDAQSILLNCIRNTASNKTIGVGFSGALNANNFIVQYDGLITGSAIDLAVPKDTAVHVVEIYGTGSTTLRARIDGGSELTAAMASAPTDGMFGFDINVRNGTTAANQSEDVDWCYMLGPRS